MGLLNIFGPSKKEIWTELSDKLGYDFIEGGFFKGSDKVVAKVKEWTITLDTYTVSSGKHSTTYTRMRAPYINKDGFRFKIYRKGLFSDLGKFFGMEDIEVGFPQFDEEFIIQGNDEYKVKELFQNEEIRRLIEIQPHIIFQVKDDEGWFGTEFPEGVDELYFSVVGVLKDQERLKALFDLFSEVLNELCIMDSAYEDGPDIKLK